MIQDIKPYPAYKDSGVPRLGDVPEHWRIQSLGSITTAKSKRGRPDLPLLSVVREKGVIPRASMLDEENHNFIPDDLSNYKVAEEGDLVINKMKAWQGSLGLAPMDGIVSPAYYVFDLQMEDKKFGQVLLRSRPYVGFFAQASDGVRVGQWDLSIDGMKRIPVVFPPADEQSAIVRFLDLSDRRIRRLIRVKRQMIGLLKEQKQAIILQAVTRGIDPCVPMKPSGMEWIGNVPDHWEVRRVKQLAKILRGKFTHRPRNDPDFYDGPYPFIQTGEVARAAKVITAYKQTLNEKGLAVSKMFPRGTLVMTIAANIGDVAVLDFEACFPDSVVGFVPGKAIDRDYLYYVFTCMKSELLREAPVNTQGNLNIDRVGARTIPVPPLTEQANIVRFIEEGTIEIDNTIAVMLKEAELIREYRIRLITDVVTGKLDVRGVAVEAVEEELEDLLDADIEEIDDEMGDDEAAEE